MARDRRQPVEDDEDARDREHPDPRRGLDAPGAVGEHDEQEDEEVLPRCDLALADERPGGVARRRPGPQERQRQLLGARAGRPVVQIPDEVQAERHDDDPQPAAAGGRQQQLDRDAGEHRDAHPRRREAGGEQRGDDAVVAHARRLVEHGERRDAGDDRGHLAGLSGDEEVLVGEAADHRQGGDADPDARAQAPARDDEQQPPERDLQRDERDHHERLVVEAADLQQAEEDAEQQDRQVLVVGLQQRRRTGAAALGHDDPLVEVERQPAREVEHERRRPGEQDEQRDLPEQIGAAAGREPARVCGLGREGRIGLGSQRRAHAPRAR